MATKQIGEIIKEKEGKVADVPTKDKKPKAPVYRKLSVKEQDMLLAIFDKHSGNISSMLLDENCIFKSWNQLAHYRDLYGFKDKLAEIRGERAKRVMANLEDSKIKALQIAQKFLDPQYQIVRNKLGVEVYDAEGVPIIVEKLPYYKEIKVAWEIIKAELGEPTEGIAIIGAKELAAKLDKVLDEDDDEIEVKQDEDIQNHPTAEESNTGDSL
jgi:hypothetical protein